MGDWRTIHLFNKTKYLKEVVPLIKNLETYLPKFLEESRSLPLYDFFQSEEEFTKETIKLVSELDEELRCHTELIRFTKITNKKYDDYYSHRNNFIRERQKSIEFFEYLIIETIFSSVADFNPYFIMGKRIFEGCVEAKDNTIALELISKLTIPDENSILDVIDGGILNWLSEEEVQLLYLDRDNIMNALTM